LCRITKSQGFLRITLSRSKLSAKYARVCTGTIAQHLRGNIATGLAQVSHLRGELARSLEISPQRVIGPVTVESEKEPARPFQRRTSRPRWPDCPPPLRPAPPPACYQHLRKTHLQIELAFPAPIAAGQRGNDREPAREQRDRLR